MSKKTVDVAAEELAILQQVRESIFRLHQRALTGRSLQMAIWKIWGHCRDNQQSLDSERHCRIVEEIVQQAVASVQSRVEDVTVELDAAQAVIRGLRKEVGGLQKEVKRLLVFEQAAKLAEERAAEKSEDPTTKSESKKQS